MSTTTTEKRCPECGSINISKKTSRGGSTQREYDTKYRCNNRTCRHHFDEPLTRQDD